MSVLPGCYHMHVWDPWSSEEGIESPRTGVTDGYVLQVGAKI